MNLSVLRLGRLETAIMTVMWQASEWLTIKEIRDQMDYPPVAYTSVGTVAGALHRKGYLRKRRHVSAGRPGPPGWQYQAATPLAHHLGELVGQLLDHSPDPTATLSRALAGCQQRQRLRTATRPQHLESASEDPDVTSDTVLAVATAMWRLSLPHLGSGFCVCAARSPDGIRLYATHAAVQPGRGGEHPAADLMVIDSLASRWGIPAMNTARPFGQFFHERRYPADAPAYCAAPAFNRVAEESSSRSWPGR